MVGWFESVRQVSVLVPRASVCLHRVQGSDQTKRAVGKINTRLRNTRTPVQPVDTKTYPRERGLRKRKEDQRKTAVWEEAVKWSIKVQ